MSDPKCKDVDPELFFGAVDSPVGSVPFVWEMKALDVCAGCAVVAPCLDEALSQPAQQQFGVVGGRTAGQRRSMLSARAAVDRARRAVERAREDEAAESRPVTAEERSAVRGSGVVGVSR